MKLCTTWRRGKRGEMWIRLGGSSLILSNPKGGGEGIGRCIKLGGGGDNGAPGISKDTGEDG